MANFDPAALTALVTLIAAAWDETEVRRSIAADRMQLEQELRELTSTLPIAFVHIGERSEPEVSSMSTQEYDYAVTVWYIGSIAGVDNVSATFETKAAALRDALIGYTSGAFQILEMPETYTESTSELNQIIMALEAGMFSTEVHFKMRVGEIL